MRAILYMGLPGEAGGEAVEQLLFGLAVPSGKLAESWPLRYSDCAVSLSTTASATPPTVRGLYVGYRWYASAGIPVRYPFGHGLSYTSFEYSDIAVEDGRVRSRSKIPVSAPARRSRSFTLRRRRAATTGRS